MSDPTMKHTLPAALANLLAEVGIEAHLIARRADGQPLTDNDRAAVRVIVDNFSLDIDEPDDDKLAAAAHQALTKRAASKDTAAHAGYGFSVRARDTRGLDPKTYAVNVGVHRRDGKPLSAEELEAIKAALAPEACAPSPSADTGGK